jgi:hypothetical protein
MAFDTLQTPDYSPLIVHFTKGERMVREDIVGQGDVLFPHRQATARERLLSILLTRTIHASPMPFLPTEQRAVCFTECIWEGLNSLAEHYSSYGVVFSKRLIFDGGGGPALYVRGDTLAAIGAAIPQDLHAFIAPFDPEARLRVGVRLDWLQEREWRLPHDLQFEYADIEYVLVESVEDATSIVHEVGAHQLPENKMIPMDVYRNIRAAWPER